MGTLNNEKFLPVSSVVIRFVRKVHFGYYPTVATCVPNFKVPAPTVMELQASKLLSWGLSNPICELRFAPIVRKLEHKEIPAKDLLHKKCEFSSSNRF